MIINGTSYNDNTPQEVVSGIEWARHNNYRVRLFYGDVDTPDFEKIQKRPCDPGKDWGEEYGTTGTIGRSTGTVKIPLLISNSRSMGGGAILDDCIVRLIVDGREFYRHPNYHQPAYTIGQPPETIGNVNMAADGYTTGVYADGENVANFKKESSALRWVAFITGKRMSK